ncbi:MAG: response regulator [Deltaproteobacteria bacterium]|nr:response regulator [Deltaproteobacteria bacterium]
MTSILVVEDEAIIAEDLSATLSRLGYRVPRTAQSGAEALRAVDEATPDLVLMDIRLKGTVDGIELTALIKRRVDVPVIYLTSHADEGTLARARETNPHGYLLKPFNEHALRSTVEIALRKHHFDAAIAERERWFSTTLRSIADAVIATDRDDAVTFMNVVAEDLTGWSHAEANGKPLSEILQLVDAAGGAIESPACRALRDGSKVELPANACLLGRAGNRVDVDDAASPIIDERGGVLGAVVVFRDVTERRKLEARLALAERLASIGTMSAGLAHELNNPLAAVLANVSFAKQSLMELQGSDAAAADPIARLARLAIEALDDAEHSGARVRRLIHDLKRFSRTDVIDLEVVKVADMLESAFKLMESGLRQSARLVRTFGAAPLVRANEGQLVQVFVNLLANAAEAIGTSDALGNVIEVTTTTDAQGRAVIDIADTGPGIPPQDLPRLFDPFFTTKPLGAGTGLGLSICARIIASFDGEITAKSTLGVGSVFRVILPATTEQLGGAVVDETPAVRKPARRARVLVIDDDELVRLAIARQLGRHHDVVTEPGGRPGLARLLTGEHFDVVLCDLMMPDMSGDEVHANLTAALPAVAARLVVLTGGAVSTRASAFLEQTTNLIIEKPFSAQELLRAVDDICATTTRPS